MHRYLTLTSLSTSLSLFVVEESGNDSPVVHGIVPSSGMPSCTYIELYIELYIKNVGIRHTSGKPYGRRIDLSTE